MIPSPLPIDMATLFEIAQRKFRFFPFPSSKLGQLCLISSFFTILAIVLSVVLAIRAFVLQDISYDVPLKGNSTTTKIAIVMHLIDIRPTAGTLTADWYPLADDCQNPEEVVNIYFDPNLLDVPGAKVASNKPPDEPIFQFNTKTWCHGTTRDSSSTFRTIVKLISDRESPQSRWTGSLQWYPWDRYFAQFSLFALLDSTNASVGILAAAPSGNPVNFNLKLDRKTSQNTDMGLYIRLNVMRSAAVQLLVIIIVLANWLASIAFLWITVASLLWPETVVKEMFMIPVAALVGFTTVRANMPGAPAGFSAFIDFVGILPNLASMAIFSATLLLMILFRRTRSESESQLQNRDKEVQEAKVDESVYARLGGVEATKWIPNPALHTEIANRLLVLMQEVISREAMLKAAISPQPILAEDEVPSYVVANDDNPKRLPSE